MQKNNKEDCLKICWASAIPKNYDINWLILNAKNSSLSFKVAIIFKYIFIQNAA